MKIRLKHIGFVMTLFIVISIFYFSSQSFYNTGISGLEWKSYVYHFCIYASLMFFLILFLYDPKKNKDWLIFAVLIAMFYGATDEFHQLFVPNRSCDIADFMTDSIGVFFSTIFYFFIIKINKKLN